MRNINDTEFGCYPEDFPLLEDNEFAPVSKEDAILQEEYLGDEFMNLPQEETKPGTYPWKERKKQDKKALYKLAVCLVASVFALSPAFNWFPGAAAEPSESIIPIEEQLKPGEKEGGQPNIEESESESQANVEESESERLTGTENENNSSNTSQEENSANSEPMESEESKASVKEYLEPECTIYALNFYSEMMAQFAFSDMKDTTAVRYEVWDTLTNSLEKSVDITSEAVNLGTVDIGSFYTDDIYMAHQAEYDAIMEFPMEVEFRVVMTYNSEDGPKEKTVSEVTKSEMLWDAKGMPPEDAPDMMGGKGGIYIGFQELFDQNVVFDNADAVDKETASISLTINGEEYKGWDNIIVEKNTWDMYMGDSDTPQTVHFIDMAVPLENVVYDGSNRAILKVTKYIAAYDKIITFTQTIKF